MEANCGNCRFWSSDGGEIGRCRINPPVIIDSDETEMYVRTFFPVTHETFDWCGKHEPVRES